MLRTQWCTRALRILGCLIMMWGTQVFAANGADGGSGAGSPGVFPDLRGLSVSSAAVRLNSGHLMPLAGFGTWTLSDAQAEQCVYAAIAAGVRLIDTARYYGNESGVGAGIRRAVQDGLVQREEIFVTSKIMPSDFTAPDAAIDASLKSLGTGWIDLMLIHQPGSHDREVWQALERGVRSGKIRSIGISNYYSARALDEVLAYAKIPPAVIQNENHLFYQNTELKRHAAGSGIVMESWYPLGGRGHTAECLGHPAVVAVARETGRTPAQVILRWQLQSGYVAIPGSANPEHIAENARIFDFELSEAQMRTLSAAATGRRFEIW